MRRRHRWTAVDAYRTSLLEVRRRLAVAELQAAEDLRRRNREAMLRVARAA